jgi:hypothetical protein
MEAQPTLIPLKLKYRDPENAPVKGIKRSKGGNGRREDRGHRWLKDPKNR